MRKAEELRYQWREENTIAYRSIILLMLICFAYSYLGFDVIGFPHLEVTMNGDSVIYQKNKKGQRIMWVLLLFVPAILMLLMEKQVMGEIGHQTPDATVYMSIADNFVKTGHFVQTNRDVEGMVVPPGTPVILTIFRILRFSNRTIMCIQILMFGICNIFLYETERTINGAGIWAPIMYTMANLRCWIILGDTIVEHYYLFLLCLGIWVMYKEMEAQRKLTYMNIIGLAMLMVRPILALVYFFILGYSLYWIVKNKKLTLGFIILLVPILVLSFNTAVNYRETGELIVLENYSGSDLYVASRPDAPVMIEEAEGYMDETYLSIVHDDSRTMQQRNQLFKELARENLQDHFGLFLLNGFRRGYEIFMKAYAWATLYTLLGGILLARKEKKEGSMRSAAILVLTLMLATISSFGVSEVRYSIVIWPMASIHGAYMTHFILRYLLRKQQWTLQS